MRDDSIEACSEHGDVVTLDRCVVIAGYLVMIARDFVNVYTLRAKVAPLQLGVVR